MKRVLFLLVMALLSACGADTATTAATAAALRKQEAEQGKKTVDQFRQRTNAAVEQLRQRAETEREAADNN